MWRTVVLAAMVYGCGHPCLDGYRPGFIDRPLQGFYNEVNQAARDGHKVLASLDVTTKSLLQGYIGRIDALLRSG